MTPTEMREELAELEAEDELIGASLWYRLWHARRFEQRLSEFDEEVMRRCKEVKGQLELGTSVEANVAPDTKRKMVRLLATLDQVDARRKELDENRPEPLTWRELLFDKWSIVFVYAPYALLGFVFIAKWLGWMT